MLRELLKNSKRSDRELSKVLKVSQPTVTRTRHKLEKNGTIQDYTIIPNFREMGFEILAVTFVKMRPDVLTSENIDAATEYAAKIPQAIFSAMGEGLGMNGVVISLHRNYTDYRQHLTQMRLDWKDQLQEVDGFLISLGVGEFKKFSLTHLGDSTV